MALLFPQFPKGVHVRTCQECWHQQVTPNPSTTKGEAWRDVKCKKCRSMALDYGQANIEVEDEG